MSVFRIEKNNNYTVMSNYHLKDQNISLKAKGLLSYMLSLPDDWNYTLRGLAYKLKEGIDAIRTAIIELEEANYLHRKILRNEKGHVTGTEYVVYETPYENTIETSTTIDNTKESPKLENPIQAENDSESPKLENPIQAENDSEKPKWENPMLDNPMSENPTQLNTNIINTNIPFVYKNNNIYINPSSYITLLEKWIKELKVEYKNDEPLIEYIKTITISFLTNNTSPVRIDGDYKTATDVKMRFMTLEKIHYKNCIHEIKLFPHGLKNKRGFILKTLYYLSTADNETLVGVDEFKKTT